MSVVMPRRLVAPVAASSASEANGGTSSASAARPCWRIARPSSPQRCHGGRCAPLLPPGQRAANSPPPPPRALVQASSRPRLPRDATRGSRGRRLLLQRPGVARNHGFSLRPRGPGPDRKAKHVRRDAPRRGRCRPHSSSETVSGGHVIGIAARPWSRLDGPRRLNAMPKRGAVSPPFFQTETARADIAYAPPRGRSRIDRPSMSVVIQPRGAL